MASRLWKAIGLMSGTSMDGVDAALIETDGYSIFDSGPHLTIPYEPAFRNELQNLVNGDYRRSNLIEEQLTLKHADAVNKLLNDFSIPPNQIDLIGFHGHTIIHKPEEKFTWQIGDGNLLAQTTGIDVINDFRSADVKAGGQGAPLVPIFHHLLTKDMELPIIILNIGGVANITWVDEHVDNLIGFDTGPGNALIDDWVSSHGNFVYDVDGKIALSGHVNRNKLKELMSHPFFDAPAPKSLDRDTFRVFVTSVLDGETLQNGAALLTAFTVSAIIRGIENLPKPSRTCIVVGGGRHNNAIMSQLDGKLSINVLSGDLVGWTGDAIEAQAFGFLGVRSKRGLAISFPGTTGVPFSMSGGKYYPVSHEKG